jgi:hypothetical protein
MIMTYSPLADPTRGTRGPRASTYLPYALAASSPNAAKVSHIHSNLRSINCGVKTID